MPTPHNPTYLPSGPDVASCDAVNINLRMAMDPASLRAWVAPEDQEKAIFYLHRAAAIRYTVHEVPPTRYAQERLGSTSHQVS